MQASLGRANRVRKADIMEIYRYRVLGYCFDGITTENDRDSGIY
jgi:hypothetical protein